MNKYALSRWLVSGSILMLTVACHSKADSEREEERKQEQQMKYVAPAPDEDDETQTPVDPDIYEEESSLQQVPIEEPVVEVVTPEPRLEIENSQNAVSTEVPVEVPVETPAQVATEAAPSTQEIPNSVSASQNKSVETQH